MKIHLDENEMAAIVKDWAKKKYGTHNVTASYSLDIDTITSKLNGVFCILEVILKEDQIAGASSELTDKAVMDALARVKAVPRQSIDEDRLAEPTFEGPAL